MDDRLTKLILIAIALGLWANLAITLVQPQPAAAQVDDQHTIAIAVQMIAYGNCPNRKLC
jgi:hypothetical protein